MDWVNSRGTDVIPTKLPIVYFQRDEFFVENGLDLRCKSEVWGIHLPPFDMMVASCCESKVDYLDIVIHSHNLHFKGMSGELPRLSVLKKISNPDTICDFNATVKILNQNGIKAENYGGNTWYSDADNSCHMWNNFYYSFDDQDTHFQLKSFPLERYRMVIDF